MDWLRFLDENNIHYVTRGPNTKKGEVSIQCPICREDDPSEHLGINLKSGKWGCLRDQSHRGNAARTLVKAILLCSSQQAWNIVKQYSHSDPDTLDSALSALLEDLGDESIAKQAIKQSLDPEFSDFSRIKVRGITKRFFDALGRRGFENVMDVIHRYDLRCAMTGKYKDRIIIPVRLNEELLGWTARALGKPIDAPRYLESSQDLKTTVFNYDDIKEGGDRLIITEGPFDAMTVDNWNFTGDRKIVCRATCTFGTSVVPSQYALLRGLAKSYNQTFVLFDQGAAGPANELASWVGAHMAYLPNNIDDPGELEDSHLEQLHSSGFDGTFYSYFGKILEDHFKHTNRGLAKRLKHKP